MKLMSAMKYDAATMGNHDFDIGLDGFLNAKQFANFPFLCANYDFSETALMDHTKAYHIFRKAGLKIGVFGIGIKLDGLVPAEKFGNTKYLEPISVANQMAKDLHEKGCDFIICLSHLGYSYAETSKPSDVRLAAENEHIDLILGGHTHTFMEAPATFENKGGTKTVVHQVGFGGIFWDALTSARLMFLAANTASNNHVPLTNERLDGLLVNSFLFLYQGSKH